MSSDLAPLDGNSVASMQIPDEVPDELEILPARKGRWRGARLRLLLCLAIVIGAITWVTVRGLSGSFVYYLTPTDIIGHHKAHVGERVRLGGFVVPGSVGHAGAALTFTVSDGTDTMKVSSIGNVPELFRAGQGVVLEGSVGADGRFHADTLLVKHNGDYRPPAPGAKPPNRADVVSGG
jgi:cytochrome c-type biogenesis protein CcmE